MAKHKAFDKYVDKYDRWYKDNDALYRSEIAALKEIIPKNSNGIEIGVGTGRFASQLGITEGIDPSTEMAKIANSRGLTVYQGTAENLPILPDIYDYALMVFTLCFLDNIDLAFRNIYTIIKPSGYFILGMFDKDSPPGQLMMQKKASSDFYKLSNFISVDETIKRLALARFKVESIHQTIFDMKSNTFQKSKPGYGEGLMTILKCKKIIQ